MATKSIQLSFLDNNGDSKPIPQALMFDDTIRRLEHEGKEYFVCVDVVGALSEWKSNSSIIWARTRKTLKKQGFELDQKCIKLSIQATNGKFYKMDCATGLDCLRIVQSIPSPKSEEVRQWFAQLGYERLEESVDPELGVQRAYNRAEDRYTQDGKDPQWIATRLHGIDERKLFTNMLRDHIANMPEWGYGQATNELYKGLWGRDAKTLKKQAGISERANLRDVQHRVALHYQGIVESVIAHHLGQSETVSYEQALAIVGDVAALIGVQAAELSRHMGIDLPTNRPLLSGGK